MRRPEGRSGRREALRRRRRSSGPSALAGAMLTQRTSGVPLDLAPIRSDLGDAVVGGYPAPTPRVRLVSVGTAGETK